LPQAQKKASRRQLRELGLHFPAHPDRAYRSLPRMPIGTSRSANASASPRRAISRR
jgi:hypothetical protein